MPWIHFHVGNGGVIKSCCVSNIPFGNINTQSLSEIWEGKPVKSLREKFLRGEQDKRCRVCRKLEETGGKSIRQETFEKFSHINAGSEKSSLPIYFDIRFSNQCNLRCRTCWHGNSSAWFAEAKALGRNMGASAVFQNIKDFNRFIEDAGEAVIQAKEIYFAGGEPLTTPEHYLLLEYLIQNKATNIKLRYNTNFSVLPKGKQNIIDYWSHFSDVEILASIDAFGELGEYIRKEMNWQKIIENREHIRIIPHVKFSIAPTISVFNILHLPKLYRKCIELNLIEKEGWYINILERPFYYNVKALPQSYKKKIEQEYISFYKWLEENNIPGQIRRMFDECLEYMKSEDKSIYWQDFLKETNTLDELRGEKIEDVLRF